jgi:hypothetical protein
LEVLVLALDQIMRRIEFVLEISDALVALRDLVLEVPP